MTCESCCRHRRLRWYLVDRNAEVELCQPCARQLRAEAEVQPI